VKTLVHRLFRPIEWPMTTKLLVTFGFIALLPLVVVGRYGYVIARQTVLQTQVRALTGHASDLASHLDFLLAERQRDLRLLAEDPAVRAFSLTWPEALLEEQADAQEALKNLVGASLYFNLVHLLDRDGRVILSTADEIGEDSSFRPYFQQALAGNVAISDISISMDSGQPVIYFSAPVRDEAGRVIAVAVLRVLAEEIWSLVEAEKDMLGPGSVAILFDEYGLRLAHSSDRSLIFKSVVPLDPQVEAQLLAGHRLGAMDKIEATNLPELAEGIRQAESQPYFTYRLAIGDELFHAGATRMRAKPWTVIEAVPESAFLAPVTQLGWSFGLAVGAVALLALLITALAARQIVKPVRELTVAARRLTHGELDRPVARFRLQPEDELGVLLQSFETMRINLKDSYTQLEARNLSLQEMNIRLQEALQAKEEMIQNVSHELRSPLALIQGYAQVVEQGILGPLTAEQEQAVRVMRRQGERLRFMVDRLLTLQTFKAEVLERIKLDLEPWLQQTIQSWEMRTAEAGIELRLEVSSSLPPLLADPKFLEQVIVNLLDNAVKFSPNGGLVRIRAWAEGDQAIIAVSDQGVGIPPDKLERVFERFYQVDRSSSRRFGGVGIGLALCKAIVEAHGGRIWAKSEGEGKGSTFYVALPAAAVA